MKKRDLLFRIISKFNNKKDGFSTLIECSKGIFQKEQLIMSAKIYEPKGKAREYSPLALNYYKGCSHNCLYCYVPNLFKRFDKNYNHNIVELRKEIPEILKSVEQSAKKYQDSNKQVLLNFTSDPYNKLEKDLKITRQVLKILLKYNIPVSILSKAGTILLRDVDIFKKFGDNIIVGQTLTFSKSEDLEKWESGAANQFDRITLLKILKYKGIKTWASFEPVIIPEQSLELLRFVCKYNLCNFVKIGKLNNYKGIGKNINWIAFLNEAVSICRMYDMPFYIKKDLVKHKDSNLYLSENETDENFLMLKNSKVLTNQLF